MVGLAAVVLAVLIAQIAVAGGSSDQAKIAGLQRQIDELRTQVGGGAEAAKKKKKKKNRRGPPGPTGATGPAGLTGATGPAGPTAGAVNGFPGNPAAAEILGTAGGNFQQTITAPVSGRLFVMFSGTSVTASCSAGNANLGLYVDGTPVPRTRRNGFNATGKAVDVFGITAPVAAGDHSLQLGFDCPSGTANSFAANEDSLGGFLLGS